MLGRLYKLEETTFPPLFQIISGVTKRGPKKKMFLNRKINFLDEVDLKHIYEGLFKFFALRNLCLQFWE